MSHLPLVNLAYDNFPICLTREGRGQSTRDPWVHFVQVRSQDFAVTAAARVIARDAHSGTEGSSQRHMLVHNFCVRCRLFLLLLLKPSLHIFLVRQSAPSMAASADTEASGGPRELPTPSNAVTKTSGGVHWLPFTIRNVTHSHAAKRPRVS